MPLTKIKKLNHMIIDRLTMILGALEMGVTTVAADACKEANDLMDVLCNEVHKVEKGIRDERTKET